MTNNNRISSHSEKLLCVFLLSEYLHHRIFTFLLWEFEPTSSRAFSFSQFLLFFIFNFIASSIIFWRHYQMLQLYSEKEWKLSLLQNSLMNTSSNRLYHFCLASLNWFSLWRLFSGHSALFVVGSSWHSS